MAKRKPIENVTTPADLLGYYVEWGNPGHRKRGTVVAWKTDTLELSAERVPEAPDHWFWINPGVEKQAKAAPKSRFPPPGPDAAIVINIQQVEGELDHKQRQTWKSTDDERPQFVSRAAKRGHGGVMRQVEGLTIIQAPSKQELAARKADKARTQATPAS